MRKHTILLLAIFSQIISSSDSQTFKWFASSPTQCGRDPSNCCGECVGHRDVSCVAEGTTTAVPNHFCFPQPNLFPSTAKCNEDKCRQDCVVGEWSPWSDCSATCGNLATEYRSRRVLVAPEAGRKCPAFSETRVCRNKTLLLPCPLPPTPGPPPPVFYLWRLGQWSECQPIGGNGVQCGPGSIRRIVNCVASNGTVVEDRHCKSTARESSPIDRQACNLPCDCRVGDWSPWSNCSAQCFTKSNSTASPSIVRPSRRRSRVVERSAQFGGTPCPTLNEEDDCVEVLPDCPRYRWENGSWLACDLDDAQAVCGFGSQARSVFCVAEGDVSLTPVDDRFCTGEFLPPGAEKTAAAVKPLGSRPCQILCPQDCVIGSWSEWSKCSLSCGDGGVQRRTRPILVNPIHGGRECLETRETRPCEKINCTFWRVSQFSACLENDVNKRCGDGVRLRHVQCLNALNQIINDTFCPGNRPAERDVCYLPCVYDCAVSDWTRWSGCPSTCGGAGVVQTRSRTVISVNSTGRCVGSDELMQRKPCNAFVPCITYVWRRGFWGNCTLPPPVATPKPFTSGSPDGSTVNSTDTTTNATGSYVNSTDSTVNSTGSSVNSTGTTVYGPAVNSTVLNVNSTDSTVNSTVNSTDSTANSTGPTVSPTVPEPATCGLNVGVQDRRVVCEQQFSGVGRQEVDDSNCLDVNNVVAGDGQPAAMEMCSIDCPVDCELSLWSEWLPCSATCGATSRLRFRFITKASAFGGKPCPKNDEGIIRMQSSCDNIPPCYTYEWAVSPWSQCSLIRLAGDFNSTCGPGFRTRAVKCRRSDNQTAADGICSLGLLTAKPGDLESCNILCADECQLGQWTAFSSCSKTCGGGLKSRSRDVLFKNSTVLAAERVQTCPHITDDQLIEQDPCNDFPCLNYGWVASEWLTCIPTSDACGDGVQERHVNCETKTDNTFVSLRLCLSVPLRPNGTRSCHIPCPVDCVVGNWSDWSVCDGPCIAGLGNETRRRSIVTEAAHGGRPCPALLQKRPCFSQCEWDVEPWGTCALKNQSLTCGDGERNRTVVCQVNGVVVDDSRCLELGAQPGFLKNKLSRTPGKPIETDKCRIPCPPDCIVGEWSEWTSDCVPRVTPFQCGVSPVFLLGKYERSRSKLRVGSIPNCQSPLEDQTSCAPLSCHSFNWQVTQWGDCLPVSGHCGIGTQQRQVVCVSDLDPLVRYPSGCNTTAMPTPSFRQCVLECPVDCAVTPWTAWNCRNDTCGGAGERIRSREIATPGSSGGRQCPVSLQRERCAFEPCFSYSYERGPWRNCSVGQNKVCGVGIRERTVVCRQSDGLLVPIECCILKHCPTVTDSTNLINVDFRALNIHTQEVCGVPCPGDCVLSAWGNWGPCTLDCTTSGGQGGMRARSRGVLVEESAGGLCVGDLIEKDRCSGSDTASCFLYSWATSLWTNGTRDVYCERRIRGDSVSKVVDSGCLLATKPASVQRCVPECDGMMRECNTTAYFCQCKAGFVEVQGKCLPLSGCLTDSHCPRFHSVCRDGKCVCSDDVVKIGPEDDTCALPTPTPTPPSTFSPSSAVTNQGGGDIGPTKALTGDGSGIPYWVWIVLAVGIVLLLGIILFIVFMRKRNSKSVYFSSSPEFERMDHMKPQTQTPWMAEPTSNPEPNREPTTFNSFSVTNSGASASASAAVANPTTADASVYKPPIDQFSQFASSDDDTIKKRPFDSYPSTLEKDTKF
eukprot:m.111462 g.111462  ORF g.111462 m.111462 type:complete len:1718 (+) comp37428_c0_seq2:104-5257(+)